MAYPDFEEFIAELNAHGARYLIVGAHALAHHARPRATKDLDVLIDATEVNAKRVLKAINGFFGVDLGYAVEDLTNPGWHIQLGVAPVRIDVLTGIAGCPTFSTMWRSRVVAKFGSEPANYLALNHLICAKQAAARPQDLADLHELRKAKRAGPQ
ncbi:MAG: hypothetical protein O3A00_27975 [Planctomycetota bacterium]|nr:hypothetical protein [Planctomycetota bacterium]